MTLDSFSETFYPSDLDALRNVFDRVCRVRGQNPNDTAEAEKLATQIVGLRMLGTVNEDELLQAVLSGGI